MPKAIPPSQIKSDGHWAMRDATWMRMRAFEFGFSQLLSRAPRGGGGGGGGGERAKNKNNSDKAAMATTMATVTAAATAAVMSMAI